MITWRTICKNAIHDLWLWMKMQNIDDAFVPSISPTVDCYWYKFVSFESFIHNFHNLCVQSSQNNIRQTMPVRDLPGSKQFEKFGQEFILACSPERNISCYYWHAEQIFVDFAVLAIAKPFDEVVESRLFLDRCSLNSRWRCFCIVVLRKSIRCVCI